MGIDDGFDSLVNQIRAAFKSVDPTGVKDHIAVQVNVTDMGNRPFYVELSSDEIKVEPYGYYDRDVNVNADSQIILAMANKKTDIRFEYTNNRIGAYGNLYKLAAFRQLIIAQM